MTLEIISFPGKREGLFQTQLAISNKIPGLRILSDIGFHALYGFSDNDPKHKAG